jgi:hypothetical protein
MNSPRLIDYVRGLLPADEAAQVAADAERDPALAEQIALLRTVSQAAEVARTVKVPEWMTRRAENLLPKTQRSESSGWRSILASLTFDSFAAAGASLRSVQESARDLNYSLAEASVTVRLEPSREGDGFLLVGLYETETDADASTVKVELVRGDQPLESTWCDEFGQFALQKMVMLGDELVVQHTLSETMSRLRIPNGPGDRD